MKFQNAIFWGFLVFFLLAGCIQQQQSQNAPPGSQTQTVALSLKYTDENGTVLLEKNISVAKGTNAFDAIKESVPLDFETTSFGPFIKSIGGVSPSSDYYLALYVNGQYADRGIAGYTLSEDTSIEWKTEKIQSAPV
ncbi:MAG: DUF4430 domain-containing protein [Candidatus Micrarchaeota archaeon]